MRFRRAARSGLVFAVLVGILGFAGGTAAAGNTIRLDPAITQVANGATFSIKVIQNAAVATSGTTVSIGYDKAVLQVTSVIRGSAFASAPLFLAGDGAAIANANKTGKLKGVAAAFFPPTSVPAGEQEFITVGFKAVGCGTVNMTVLITQKQTESAMLDGRTATYGNTIKLTATGATVTVCEGGAGASAPAGASAGASALPGASDSVGPVESNDPNASASAAPAPGDSPQPGASAPPMNDTAFLGTTSEQSGWLNFATAALAVAAAGLATLIIVLTIIAIGAAIVGTVVVIRVWRRGAEKDAKASLASVATVDAAATPGTATDGAPAERDAPADLPTGTAIPLPSAQS
jgi:hypothetical protein